MKIETASLEGKVRNAPGAGESASSVRDQVSYVQNAAFAGVEACIPVVHEPEVLT